MLYPLTLGSAFLIVGLLLLVLGAVALGQGRLVQPWLQALPRSRGWGVGLLVIAAGWWFWLLFKMDLGEFDKYRHYFLVLTVIATYLTAVYVEEFLAARALGMLILLGAEPMLEAAFLQPQLSRLFLVSLVYAAIVVGMFWIGMPYLLRDFVGWLTSSERRWKTSALASIGYGALLLICCLTLHRSS